MNIQTNLIGQKIEVTTASLRGNLKLGDKGVICGYCFEVRPYLIIKMDGNGYLCHVELSSVRCIDDQNSKQT